MVWCGGHECGVGDVWGHVGLGMGPILITHESIFMALAPQPGIPGSVPIGGRYSVQSKSGQPQHGSGSVRIPAWRPPPAGEGAPPGEFSMPPPPLGPPPPLSFLFKKEGNKKRGKWKNKKKKREQE